MLFNLLAVVTTTSGGTGTADTAAITGLIKQIIVFPVGFASGWEVVITGAGTGVEYWAETGLSDSGPIERLPRFPVHDSNGNAMTFDGTRLILEPIASVAEGLHIAVSSAGTVATSGTFIITYEA